MTAALVQQGVEAIG